MAVQTTVLEKSCRLAYAGYGQSIVQTQKSREFPGCRIIHTFYRVITPPDGFAARREDFYGLDFSR